MDEAKLKTPITFIIFNRPKQTERTFEMIAEARPEKLLVIADGPRADRPGEAEKCAAARKIIERVDWNCEVLTNYSSQNLGCKHRVASGLDWAFQTVEETIVLEDDCLPHPSFFQFCQELLEKYRDDERIGVISGDNFLFGKLPISTSYYFSLEPHLWGWASWRRVWQNYDIKMSSFPQILQDNTLQYLLGEQAAGLWKDIFTRAYLDKVDTWDYQFVYSLFLQNQLTITPGVNLISNIGFGDEATHTNQVRPLSANLPTEPMSFPLVHPSSLLRHFEADQLVNKILYGLQENKLASLNAKSLTFNRQKMHTQLPEEIRQATLTTVQLQIQEATYQVEFGTKAKALLLYQQALDRLGEHPAFNELIGYIRSMMKQLA